MLSDTLLRKLNKDEILAFLSVALAHWKLGHVATRFVVLQLYSLAAWYCFSLCYRNDDLYRAFGFDDPNQPVPTIVALSLFFETLWVPVDKVLNLLVRTIHRQGEFEADRFVAELDMGKSLQTALCKMSVENLEPMHLDPWFSAYHYPQPPLAERLGALIKADEKEV